MVVCISQISLLIIGVIIIVLGGWGIFSPDRLMTFVTSAMDKHWGIYVAVIVRLVLGAALIIVAPTSLFPVVFHALGVLAIVAAIVLLLMGRERMRRFIAWFSEWFSAPVIRLWLLFGVAFGGFLIYGVYG